MLQVIGLGVILARSAFWTTATVLKQTCQKQRNIIRTNAHQEHKNDINCDQHVFSQPASSMIWTAADKSCHCFFHLAIAWNFKKCWSRHNINDTNLVQSLQTVELRELNQFGSPSRLPIDVNFCHGSVHVQWNFTDVIDKRVWACKHPQTMTFLWIHGSHVPVFWFDTRCQINTQTKSTCSGQICVNTRKHVTLSKWKRIKNIQKLISMPKVFPNKRRENTKSDNTHRWGDTVFKWLGWWF